MLGFDALGVYALGQSAVVVTSGVLPLAGEASAFVLGGQPALFHQTRKADAGAFTLTGQPASRRITTVASAGAFTFTGNATNLLRQLVLTTSPEIVTFGRQPLFAALGELPLGGSIANGTQATTFLFIGNNTDGARGVGFSPEVGAFVFTGFDADLNTGDGYPSNIRIFPRVGRGLRGFTSGRSANTTGPLVWDGDAMVWNGDPLVWNGTVLRGGIIVRTSVGRGLRARAFGG
jgi:hypothetical protein